MLVQTGTLRVGDYVVAGKNHGKVKALLDCNVNDYILSVRLQKARHYLNQGELTVAEVAYKVGFTSPGYFSTVFKTRFGISPKEFKEQ